MTLRLGQNVEYFPKINDPLASDDGRLITGIITRINNSDHANVTVANPSGHGWEGRENVRVIEDPGIALERGCCRPVEVDRLVSQVSQRVYKLEQELEGACERLDKLIDQLETQLRNDGVNGQSPKNVSKDAAQAERDAQTEQDDREADRHGVPANPNASVATGSGSPAPDAEQTGGAL